MKNRTTIIWLCFAGALVLFYFLSPILTPFFIAAFIAYLADPLVNQLQRLKLPRLCAVLVVFILMSALVALFLLIFIPLLQQQITNLFAKVPDIIAWVELSLLPWLNEHLGLSLSLDANYLKQALPNDLQQAGAVINNLSHTLFSSSKTVFVWVANLLFIPVLLFYLLRDWPVLLQNVKNLLPRRNEPGIMALARECNEVLGAFLRGQFLVMLSLGLIYSLGLTLIGLNTSFLIGLSAGLLCIVPYLGFIVGIAAALIAALLQFHDITHCIYVIIVFVIAQSIEGTILTPNLVGDRIGLHPVAVIFSILAGGQLFGFFGILLALPVAAVAMVFLRHLRKRYINSQLYRT
ncbi:MAG: AI-2E family transporter [Gammaproteobacteria bacterium]|nr:AI-2E family transporter [Gammaproteobacteria bacterium]